ncbi:MalY/PatB family protein [Fusobacterium sp.]|uniref:MalY/PatB family protein n=1 Tax=Fusobacterium sp. TaxID=68766 RepID=UPI002904B513|nr:MalY/PatB family protein [Fusobacterium sp.]MDU1910537.1 MalY/PatB family protein [Fusobacterium sp.]
MKFDEIKDRRGTYCTQWDYVKDRFGKDNLLPFTISDMDLESPEEIVDALIKRINHRIFGYSRWNHDDFKNSIEGWYNRRFNFQINKEWVVYSPSVIYAISKFIEMKSQKGEGVLINTPGYDGFFKVIIDNDRKLLTSPLKKVKDSYEIDFDDFELKCKEAKIFLLCSPHNPTGKVWTEEELKKMIEICKKYDVFIISDEIHMDIIYKGKHHPILSQACDYMKNIVLCTSASKTFNIPALCGSYLFITNQKDRDEFLRILKNRDALSSPSILAVIATITAYNKCEYWVNELVKYTENNIKYVKEYLEKNIPVLKCEIPQGSYFAWIDFSKLSISNDEFQRNLINIGEVAIMPGLTYGEEGRYYIRLNVGCSIKKVEEGLKRIEKTVKYIENRNN